MENFKNDLIMQLRNVGSFTTEMMMIIDQAISSVIRNYEIKRISTEIVSYNIKTCPELDSFLMRKEFRGCSNQTIKQYRYLLNAYVAWFDKDVKEANADDIRAFLTDYANINKISDRTKDAKRLIIRSFYTFLHQNGYIKNNPSIAVEPIKYIQKVREPLSVMEVEMVRRVCNTSFDEALFEVFYSTGCRVSEVVNMKISDVDFNNDQIKVYGKGKKERIVLLTARAHLALREYLATRDDDNTGLFVSKHGTHQTLGKCSLENRIKNLGIAAGLNRTITCHILRHSAITHWHDVYNIPLENIRQMSGHTKLETVQIYLHSSLGKAKQLYQH